MCIRDRASVNSLQFDEELEECTLILDDLEDLVQQYEGNFNDDEYQRKMCIRDRNVTGERWKS